MDLEAALAALRATSDPGVLGRYQLLYRLAQGGMGAVYLARQLGEAGFSRWVAVKVIHPHIQDDASFVAMFLDEARLAARLEHPNLCRVTDFGTENGRYFLVLEYLQGETLSTILDRCHAEGGLPPTLAARVIAEAARGLHAAHELRAQDGALAQVVHRDVSPQNLMVLYDGQTKVLDFGIARSRERSAAPTEGDVLKGKLSYLAPELFEGAPGDRRIDLYALGVVLWEATTGRRLFKGRNDAETLRSILRGAPPPSSVAPRYPAQLEALVMRALAIDPAQRFQTGDELARALEDYLALAGAYVGPAQLSDFLGARFRERKESRELLLRLAPPPGARAPDAPPPEAPPAEEPTTETPPPEFGRLGEGTATFTPPPAVLPQQTHSASPAAPSALRPRPRAALALAGTLALLGVAALGVRFLRPSPVPAALPPAPRVSSPPQAPPAPPAVVPAVVPAPSPAPPAPPLEPAAPAPTLAPAPPPSRADRALRRHGSPAPPAAPASAAPPAPPAPPAPAPPAHRSCREDPLDPHCTM